MAERECNHGPWLWDNDAAAYQCWAVAEGIEEKRKVWEEAWNKIEEERESQESNLADWGQRRLGLVKLPATSQNEKLKRNVRNYAWERKRERTGSVQALELVGVHPKKAKVEKTPMRRQKMKKDSNTWVVDNDDYNPIDLTGDDYDDVAEANMTGEPSGFIQ